MVNKPSIFKRSPQGKEVVDIEEVFNIWNLLDSRYRDIQTIQILQNFVHDRDLSRLMSKVMSTAKSQLKVLENEGKAFKINLPPKPPKGAKTSTQVQELSDQHIYRTVFSDLRDDLFLLSRSVRTSTTNDRIRGDFAKWLQAQVDNYEQLLKFGRIKAWQSPVPSYKTAKAQGTEPISVAEAYHIWDHLGQRYDQIQLTELFLGFAHDTEFQSLLNTGSQLMNRQAKQLEAEALKFEVPLPERPPHSVDFPIDPETLRDDFLYRTILRGIQEVMDSI